MVGQPRFTITHHSRQIQSRKGEDVVVVPDEQRMKQQRDKVIIFAVCDGHAGNSAAEYVAKNIEGSIKQEFKLYRVKEASGVMKQAELIKKSIKQAFINLDREFGKQYFGETSGTTLTVAVFYGRLLTVANVGDSKAILLSDDGHYTDMSIDHRIDVNEQEQMRLISQGACVERLKLFGDINGEGVGPLRIWPAGLAVSRSIGDRDARPFVVPYPQVKSVVIPEQGGRLIIASDGLWDLFSTKQVAGKAHTTKLEEVSGVLLRNVQKVSRGVVKDDTSVVVADVFPRWQQGLYDTENRKEQASSFWGCWGCPKVLNDEKGERCLSIIANDDTVYEDLVDGPLALHTSLPFIKDMQQMEEPISEPSSKEDLNGESQSSDEKLSVEVRGLRRSLSAGWENKIYKTQVSEVDRVGGPSRKQINSDV